MTTWSGRTDAFMFRGRAAGSWSSFSTIWRPSRPARPTEASTSWFAGAAAGALGLDGAAGWAEHPVRATSAARDRAARDFFMGISIRWVAYYDVL